MKCILASFFSLIIILSCFSVIAYSTDEITVSAKSAVLYCADNGETVFEKNAREQLPVASTTKIMTALLTLEQNTPERVVTVSKNAVTVEGTSMGLKAGDKVSLYTLACGMLLSSGNDAANAAAEAISGSNNEFASLMNKKARQIGMSNTCFSTPSGLDAENHYSTAFDMALLGSYAIKNAQFCEICSSRSKTVSFENPKKSRTLYNHNKLLDVEGVFGIKTGFTKKSGRCLVSACKRNGITLVCVTLNDPDDWLDHKKLYDYGFENYCYLDSDFTEVSVKTVGSTSKRVDVISRDIPLTFGVDEDEVTRLVLTEPFVYAPLESGQKVGEVYYYDKDGKLLFFTDLLSLQSVEQSVPLKREKKSLIDKITDLFRRQYG